MSQADFKKFMSSMQSDAGIRSELVERYGEGGSIPAEQLISMASERGYTFTVEEAQEELSDSALEGVAGGAGGAFLKLEGVEGESLKYMPKVEYRVDTRAFNINFIKFG